MCTQSISHGGTGGVVKLTTAMSGSLGSITLGGQQISSTSKFLQATVKAQVQSQICWYDVVYAHMCFPPIFTGFDAYPSVTDLAEANFSSMECGLPTQLSFNAREIADGTLFKAIEDYDPDSKRLLYQLQKCVFF